ncbi:OpgC domain-containing protein [Pseudorhodoferax sp. Leaf267]|uniref:OpgC domain-containing protein n=1 Tax=Pseudorhodoferax sp. Leaf267 TaxID=1736316 RepID=UPI0006F89493|nr:OpgC domain-containing protein [Pseudorhodoferax sp. Leaf267]KQP21522.1 acyltransferase [Pseudorhodoferax sp. Leaf267]
MSAPAAAAAPAASGERLWQVDALRGLMLVLMTLTHLPTRFSSPTGQPFGFVSAAEGFVLLSGFMAGMVYAARERREGEDKMRAAFYKRVLKIYLCQAALLAFLFSVVAVLAVVAQQEAITGLMRYYLHEPLHALVGSLLLLYSPPLLDILPLYILFMLVSPVLLLHGLRHGWGGILAISVALWLGAQFKLGAWLYEAAASATRLPVPLEQTGAFDVLAWQFLWVMGLWLGAERSTRPDRPPLVFPRWMLITAIVVAAIGFVWRHVVGQVPIPGNASLNMLFDKWQLAPLRIVNLFALLVLTVHFAPWMATHLPRPRFLETMGAASLPVFFAHLVAALLALALFGAPSANRSWFIDIGILVVSFAALYAVALASQELDRQAAAAKRRRREKLKARAAEPSPTPATVPR